MRKQLEDLRKVMAAYSADVYIVTTCDDHNSEYVGPHFHSMDAISGFTGGDGTLVIAKDEAGLWTDGRYFIQAAAQLKDTGVELMKMGEPETPDMTDWIRKHMPEGGKLGFDGKCLPYSTMNAIIKALRDKNITVMADKDLVDEVWEGRPAEEFSEIFVLSEEYTGMSAANKISDLRADMKELGAQAHVISTLDDIAWLLNLRAADIPCNPVFSSFLLINGDDITLYSDKAHFTPEILEYLENLGVYVDVDTEDVYGDIARLSCENILMEKAVCNFRLVNSVPEGVGIIDHMNPTTTMKCYKNATEMEGIRKAQIKDSVALTKFMYWFKQNVASGELTEWNTLEKLHEFRSEQEGFLDESFGTISSYGPNCAMPHYAPSKDRDVKIEPRSVYLLDSGGQYYEGTTDCTRTWACGPMTEEERTGYTLTLMAHLRLQDARFLEGTSGVCLDYAAREPFWRRGINFNHGTGHGVGHVLNVHERPVGIRYKIVPERVDSYPMMEGVYVSDEPGIYIEGKYGVRIENMLLCVKDFRNEFGQFMKFEPTTMVPIETEFLMKDLMTDNDIELINNYHQKVRENISGYLKDDEGLYNWFLKMTEPVVR